MLIHHRARYPDLTDGLSGPKASGLGWSRSCSSFLVDFQEEGRRDDCLRAGYVSVENGADQIIALDQRQQLGGERAAVDARAAASCDNARAARINFSWEVRVLFMCAGQPAARRIDAMVFTPNAMSMAMSQVRAPALARAITSSRTSGEYAFRILLLVAGGGG